jgi:hypothetical protein
MTHLRDQIAVDCPPAESESRLEAYFASRRGVDGISRLRLRVPMTKNPHGLRLDREVRIEASRARDEDNLNDLIRITWIPEGGIAFPRFEGTLVVWGEERANRSYIELDGAYTPPLSAAGEMFDAAVGHDIAKTTAREFLEDLKNAIERARIQSV